MKMSLSVTALSMHWIILTVDQLQDILSNWKHISAVSTKLWKIDSTLYHIMFDMSLPVTYYSDITKLLTTKWKVYKASINHISPSVATKVLHLLPRLSQLEILSIAVEFSSGFYCPMLQYLINSKIGSDSTESWQLQLLEVLKDIIKKHAYLKEFSILGYTPYTNEDFAECIRERLKLVMDD